MAEEKDFNDVLEEIFVNEETAHKNSFEEGFKAGKEAGNPEGFHLGYHRGAELGRELGFYLGTVTYHIQTNECSDTKLSDKILSQLTKVKELIDTFPHTNSEEHDILAMAERIRAQYKKTCALLKYFRRSTMDPVMLKLRSHIDSVLKYLTPLLPLANCHMVEFITHNHWDNLLPEGLRKTLDGMPVEKAVEGFWTSCESDVCDESPVSQWVHSARSHYLTLNEYCLSVKQLEDRIQSWGGVMQPEIRVKEFMTSKKSYEVATMSRLLASLYRATNASLALEAGGGRGALLAAANRAYGIRCLTVDCDPAVLASAEARSKLIQKQWHAIAKVIHDGSSSPCSAPRAPKEDLHRFARLFITEHSELVSAARNSFPDLAEDVGVLLTGLHTCGNLGPNSLRIFVTQPSTCAALTVPCCYHLLTEDTDGALFDVFQKNYGGGEEKRGFPMSEHLRGYKLGRNARMLAAQSIDRVVSQRQWPSKSLLYRALLQNIIKKHKPDFVLAEGKLKRVAAKSQDFEQYFKMADSILNLELFDSVHASALNMDCQWKKMVMFYLIRLCLAQVIESLILLDRLLFLRENGFQNAFLVKLFDPVLSPRCHSIVVVRRK